MHNFRHLNPTGKLIVALVLVTLLFAGAYLLFANQSAEEGVIDTGIQTSGIRGTLTVGPTCPVEQYPPQEECADRPLKTLVAIFRRSDPVHAVVITESNANGQFEAKLPPGEYIVGAGEGTLPYCPQTPTTVAEGTYTAITISCDSGIR